MLPRRQDACFFFYILYIQNVVYQQNKSYFRIAKIKAGIKKRPLSHLISAYKNNFIWTIKRNTGSGASCIAVRKNNGFSENNKDYRGCFKWKSHGGWSKFFIGKVCVFKNNVYLCIAFENKASQKELGEMAEWSIAAVLKTVVLRGTGGSNPSLSAESKTKDFTKAFKKSFKAPYISWLRCFFIFAPQQGEGLNVGFSLQSSVIICYIYCYTLKTPQKNVAVTEKWSPFWSL